MNVLRETTGAAYRCRRWLLSRDMSYPATDLRISLYDMQHLPALSWETPKRIDLGALISRIVAPWILSLLVATWPKGVGTGKPPRHRHDLATKRSRHKASRH
jgi:hypothetical protein